MRLFTAVLVIVASVSSVAEQKWFRVPLVCGQVCLGKEVLKDTPFVIYKSLAKHIPCCEQTEKLNDGRTDKTGNFLMESLDEGYYCVVLERGTKHFIAPLWVKQQCYDHQSKSIQEPVKPRF